MNEKDFITQQLAATGWAPIDHEMAKLLCPDVGSAFRDFAVDQRNPESLVKVFPGTRLYQAQVEGFGTVTVLARSALFLAERIQFLGFMATEVIEFDAKTSIARPDVAAKPAHGTSDRIALVYANLITKEPPRPCNRCGRMSSGQTCLAALRGEITGAPRDYHPDINVPRICLSFCPPHGTHDDRTGRQLWPEIVAVVEKPKAKDKPEGAEQAGTLERASELLAEMLKEGPRNAAEIRAAAEGAGISERSMQVAAERMGAVKSKAGFAGGWIWSMPVTEAA